MNFKELISPVSTGDFFSTYYEKKHLHIKRNSKTFYQDVLTIKELDTILFSIGNTFPDFRVANNDSNDDIISKAYTLKDTPIIDPLKFIKAYKEGATLVMSALQIKHFNLRTLTNELSAFFKHKFQTNVYATPQNSQGFSTHFDTHDVFILQISGHKTCRIYDQPITLADSTYEYNKATFVPGNVIDEFTLEQGDLLYIPRGIVHDAYCTTNQSVHITTGLMGKTWAVQLAEMLAVSSKKFEVLRKFPKTHEYDSTQKSKEVEDLKSAVIQLIDNMHNDSFEDDFYSMQRSIAKGYLHQAILDSPISLDSKVKLREKHNVRLHTSQDVLTIKFYDFKLNMPAMCKEFLDILLNEDSFVPVKDINVNFDNDSKLLLINQLDTIGLVEIENV